MGSALRASLALAAFSAAAGAGAVENAGAGAPARPDLSGVRRWACFYGRALSSASASALELAVLDPDRFESPALPASPAPGPPWRVAYVNAGEAEDHRGYWPAVKGAAFLVEPDPGRPGSWRADLRDPAWRKVLLDRVVPAALARGYHGVFLDTLDTAGYLEAKDPARFAGSAAAAVELVLELRRRHPGALILVNNALPLLARLGPAIDAAVVEDLYTRRDPERGYAEVPRALSRSKERTLLAFTRASGRPVLPVVYAPLGGWEEAGAWVSRARRLGFAPYLAGVRLERLGRADP